MMITAAKIGVTTMAIEVAAKLAARRNHLAASLSKPVVVRQAILDLPIFGDSYLSA